MTVLHITDLVFGVIAIVSGLGFMVSLILYMVLGRGHILRSNARDTLILAAHPDDCVISAGEYGIWATASGKCVRIVYMTSGDRSPDSQRARIREAEALKVWQRVGVSPEDIMFLRLPNSPLRGPSLLNQTQISEAERQIALAIASMPADAAVFLPAIGDSPRSSYITLNHSCCRCKHRPWRTNSL